MPKAWQVPEPPSSRFLKAVVLGGGAVLVVASLAASLAFGFGIDFLFNLIGTGSVLVIVPLVVVTSLLRWVVKRWVAPPDRDEPQATLVTLIRIYLLLAMLTATVVLGAGLLIVAIAGSALQTAMLDAVLMVSAGLMLFAVFPLHIIDNCLLALRMLTRTEAIR